MKWSQVSFCRFGFSITYYSEILTAFNIVVHIKESAIEFLEIAKSKKILLCFFEGILLEKEL